MLLNAVTFLLLLVPLALGEGEPTQPSEAFRYTVASIEHKGPRIAEGNMVLTATEGHEFVDVTVRVEPLAKAEDWKGSGFGLETIDGVKASAVYGDITLSHVTEWPTTVTLRMSAPKGARFKTLRLNGMTIDVSLIRTSKDKPVPPK